MGRHAQKWPNPGPLEDQWVLHPLWRFSSTSKDNPPLPLHPYGPHRGLATLPRIFLDPRFHPTHNPWDNGTYFNSNSENWKRIFASNRSPAGRAAPLSI
eukprot:2153668-Amphidinium_carterae.1